jgi:hypothetical protein
MGQRTLVGPLGGVNPLYGFTTQITDIFDYCYYTITFTTPFNAAPIMSLSPLTTGSSQQTVVNLGCTTAGCTFYCGAPGTAGGPYGSQYSFICNPLNITVTGP